MSFLDDDSEEDATGSDSDSDELSEESGDDDEEWLSLSRGRQCARETPTAAPKQSSSKANEAVSSPSASKRVDSFERGRVRSCDTRDGHEPDFFEKYFFFSEIFFENLHSKNFRLSS